MSAEKLAMLAGLISTFYKYSSAQPQTQHTTQKTQKNTAKKMSCHHPTLHQLCPLSPWQQLPQTQLLVPPLPIGPRKVRVGYSVYYQ